MQVLPDGAIMSEVEDVVTLDKGEDFHNVALLTACHLEALWDWPVCRGTLMMEDGTARAPHAWNELPDGGILDAQNPFGIKRVFPGDPSLERYRSDWFPWLGHDYTATKECKNSSIEESIILGCP